MASTKNLPAENLPADAPDSKLVQLKCESLGVTSRDFTPAHAKALLKLQQERGLSDWQPVGDAPAQ